MWLLPVPGLPMSSPLMPSLMNLKVCNSKHAWRGTFGLKCQSKSASVKRSSSPHCLKRRSVKRERLRSSSSCSSMQKVSRKGCPLAWACRTRGSSVAANPVKESEPKWGLSGLEYEVDVVAGIVRRLWRSQRCGKCPRIKVPVDGPNPHLRQQVCAFIGPAHLTPFGPAPTDHLVHCGHSGRVLRRCPGTGY